MLRTHTQSMVLHAMTLLLHNLSDQRPDLTKACARTNTVRNSCCCLALQSSRTHRHPSFLPNPPSGSGVSCRECYRVSRTRRCQPVALEGACVARISKVSTQPRSESPVQSDSEAAPWCAESILEVRTLPVYCLQRCQGTLVCRYSQAASWSASVPMHCGAESCGSC